MLSLTSIILDFVSSISFSSHLFSMLAILVEFSSSSILFNLTIMHEKLFYFMSATKLKFILIVMII